MKIVIASNNSNKIREIREIFSDFEFELLSLEEAGIKADIEESGNSFEENAMIKAAHIFERYGVSCMADDSGLCVDALNGAPGVYSARFSDRATDDSNNALLLEKLEGMPADKRGARFCCSVALFLSVNNGMSLKIIHAAGEVGGTILKSPAGEGGFGYDPLFYVPKFGCSMAELTPKEKNSVSHRGRALRQLRENYLEYIASSLANK